MPDAEIIQLQGQKGSARAARARLRCSAATRSGRRCRNVAVTESGFCRTHAGTEAARAHHPSGRDMDASPDARSDRALQEQASFEAFIRARLSGEYPIDDFGFDEELARRILLPLVRPLYTDYFRVRTLGMERIPDSGPALLVANHSGTIPLDSIIMQYAVATEHPRRRLVRNVGADLVWRLPFIGPLGRKSGNVVACDEDAYELLRRGELLGVFPEGYKGVGKGWQQRYKLQRFGRGGFIEVALKTQVPIIPVSIVGAEEAYPMVANAKTIARMFGFPYFPLTATFPWLGPLGLLPLPSRWLIEFGDPIPMDEYPADAAEDAMLVFDLTDRIRDTIQQMIYRNLQRRGGAFL